MFDQLRNYNTSIDTWHFRLSKLFSLNWRCHESGLARMAKYISTNKNTHELMILHSLNHKTCCNILICRCMQKHRPGSDGNGGILCISQSSNILEAHHQIVYCHIQDTHCWLGCYPFAEVHSVYSTTPTQPIVKFYFVLEWCNFSIDTAIGSKFCLQQHFAPSHANTLPQLHYI